MVDKAGNFTGLELDELCNLSVGIEVFVTFFLNKLVG